MKQIIVCFCLILTYNVFAQGTTDSVNYIKVNSYNSPSINIADIDDFLKLMTDNKIRDVFVTDALFMIQGQSVMYTLNTNGYKNLADYKNGQKFNNGASYYFALKNNLPNQSEVDYYKQEGFLTNEDYQDALRLGVTHSNIQNMTISGFITKDDFQKNIKYLNSVIFLNAYKDWQSMAIQTQSRQNNYYNQNLEAQRLENERTQRQKREQDGITLLKNADIDFVIDKANKSDKYNKPITKLSNFDYYYINIPLQSEKDSVFYYGLKFCQFKNISEYKSNQSKYSLRNTDQIIKQFSFVSVDEMIDADKENILNGNDYHLVCEYLITSEQLNQNRTFINELEAIKQKYLQNLDIDKRLSRVRASDIKNYYPSEKASGRNIYAFMIFALLKQKKGIPVSYSNFVQNVQKEYANMSIYHRLSFDEKSVSSAFAIPAINNLVVNNSEGKSFYLK